MACERVQEKIHRLPLFSGKKERKCAQKLESWQFLPRVEASPLFCSSFKALHKLVASIRIISS
jgi:hypothetical protein